jgi:hypothetical protein
MRKDQPIQSMGMAGPVTSLLTNEYDKISSLSAFAGGCFRGRLPRLEALASAPTASRSIPGRSNIAVDYIHDSRRRPVGLRRGQVPDGVRSTCESDTGLELREGAVLLGSLNPFDYDKDGHADTLRFTALLLADGQRNISDQRPKGIIDGQGRQVAANIVALVTQRRYPGPFDE